MFELRKFNVYLNHRICQARLSECISSFAGPLFASAAAGAHPRQMSTPPPDRASTFGGMRGTIAVAGGAQPREADHMSCMGYKILMVTHTAEEFSHCATVRITSTTHFFLVTPSVLPHLPVDLVLCPLTLVPHICLRPL